MISTKKLLYFIAVAEEKHFGQAAIRLGISQPPLSKQIKQLESELQTQLFVRTTRTVSLTPTGKALLEHAKKIIDDLEHCHTVIQETAYKANKYIRLGALHAHIYSFVPDLLRLYFNQNPNFNAHLIEYNTDEQLSKILNETVDLGIVREPISHPEIRVKNLFQEQYVLALPDAWIKDELLNQVSITEFQHLTMISYPSHDKTRSTTKLFDDFFRQHEVQLQNKIEVKTIHSALALVAAGKGFAPVPQSQTSVHFPNVRYMQTVESTPSLSVGIAWRKRFLDYHLQDFLNFAKIYFANNNFTTYESTKNHWPPS